MFIPIMIVVRLLPVEFTDDHEKQHSLYSDITYYVQDYNRNNNILFVI